MAKYVNLEKVNKAFFDTRLCVLSKIYEAYGEKEGKILLMKWAEECGRSPSTIRAAITSLKLNGLVESDGQKVRIMKGVIKESQKAPPTAPTLQTMKKTG